MKRAAIIMAGGSGERFWPLSRRNHPKQLLKLLNPDKTLLDESIERIARVIPPEDIFIITGEHLLQPIRESLRVVPPENVIAEPAKRNTAPCLALGAAVLLERYGLNPDEIVMAVLTADQLISPDEKFAETIDGILNYVSDNAALATIGIKPTRPETGYGYIEVEEKFIDDGNLEIRPAQAFREKPGYSTACKYIESGRYLWNSGMFFWRLDEFIAQMIKQAPEIGTKIDEMKSKYSGLSRETLTTANPAIQELFEGFNDISIDYALMEKADSVVVAKALFQWDDVGSWDSLERVKQKDSRRNIAEGNIVMFDSKDNIIINSSADKIVGLIGIENMAIIATEDALLVCPKDRVQEIKKIAGDIKQKYDNKWL